MSDFDIIGQGSTEARGLPKVENSRKEEAEAWKDIAEVINGLVSDESVKETATGTVGTEAGMGFANKPGIKDAAKLVLKDKTLEWAVAGAFGTEAGMKFAKKMKLRETLKFVLTNWSVIAALIYMLFPIDLIPDTIPIVGQIDDMAPILFSMCHTVSKAMDKMDAGD